MNFFFKVEEKKEFDILDELRGNKDNEVSVILIECKFLNFLYIVLFLFLDIDVLEIKFIDKEGREGIV